MNLKSTKKSFWIITDIDGTLMDHNYDFSPALPTIKWLQSLAIPIIPCTSKTASEVRIIRESIGLKDPFIVENGGAIYGEDDSSGKEWELILGKSYEYLRSKLKLISDEIGYQLKPLNDLSNKEIFELTGLNENGIKLALQRQWSVPFLNPPEKDLRQIIEISLKLNTSIYKGNRMSHLLAKGSHKGKAVNQLKKFFNLPEVKIIALGDSQNDLPLLEAADIAVVVPSEKGPNPILKEGIERGDFLLAPAPHAEGWSISVQELIKKNI